MTKLLVLSPHLDDAVLSCGRLLARCRCGGHTLSGKTVTTRLVDPLGPPLWLRRSGYIRGGHATT